MIFLVLGLGECVQARVYAIQYLRAMPNVMEMHQRDTNTQFLNIYGEGFSLGNIALGTASCALMIIGKNNLCITT
jgi:hypothetical protein